VLVKRGVHDASRKLPERDGRVNCGNVTVWFQFICQAERENAYTASKIITMTGKSNNTQPAMQTIKPGDGEVIAMPDVGPV
jgi:hypothetical protein